MDARIPKEKIWDLYRPLAMWTLERTVLGNPDVDILEDLRQLAGRIEVQEIVSRNLLDWTGNEAAGLKVRSPSLPRQKGAKRALRLGKELSQPLEVSATLRVTAIAIEFNRLTLALA
jgi:hypothetical protein